MTEPIITGHDWAPGQMYVYSLAEMNRRINKLSIMLGIETEPKLLLEEK